MSAADVKTFEVHFAIPKSSDHDRDPICGNCAQPRSKHHFEDRIYCFHHTNGDVFTSNPSDDAIAEMFFEENPDLYTALLARWKRQNGHPIDDL